MAQYKIHHTCGHVETKQLYGKTDSRQRTIAFEESRLCRDCYNAAQAQAATAAGRQVLTGTDRQVAWAMGLREKAIARIDEEAKSYIRSDSSTQTITDIEATRTRAHAIADAETEAKWWIDNRDRSIFRMAFAELRKELGC